MTQLIRSGLRETSHSSSSDGSQKAARWIVVVAILIEVQGPRVAGSLRLNIAIVALLLLLLVLRRGSKISANAWILTAWPILPLFLYCLWCGVSAIWAYSAGEAILQSGLLLLVLVVSTSYAENSPAVFAREVVKVCVALAMLSWAMAVAIPSVAVLPDITWRLNGPMQHSQRLSLICGAALVLLVALRRAGERTFSTPARELGAAVLLLATLLATQTRANTAFIAVAVGAVVYARSRPWQKVLLLGSFIAFVLWIYLDIDFILGSIDREGSNTMTLTGRTHTWSASLEMIAQREVLGYGFGSFFSPLTAHFFASGYVSPHAHNTWINSTFETGLIGMGLLTLFLIGAVIGSRKLRAVNQFAWPVVLLGVLAGLTGIVYGGKLSTLWAISVVLVCQAVATARSTSFEHDRDRAPRRRYYRPDS